MCGGIEKPCATFSFAATRALAARWGYLLVPREAGGRLRGSHRGVEPPVEVALGNLNGFHEPFAGIRGHETEDGKTVSLLQNRRHVSLLLQLLLEGLRHLGIDGHGSIALLPRFVRREDLRARGLAPHLCEQLVRSARFRLSGEPNRARAFRRLSREEHLARLARFLMLHFMDLLVEREPGPEDAVHEDGPADDLLVFPAGVPERLLDRLPLVGSAGLL